MNAEFYQKQIMDMDEAQAKVSQTLNFIVGFREGFDQLKSIPDIMTRRSALIAHTIQSFQYAVDLQSQLFMDEVFKTAEKSLGSSIAIELASNCITRYENFH